jgi:hypothetical protein
MRLILIFILVISGKASFSQAVKTTHNFKQKIGNSKFIGSSQIIDTSKAALTYQFRGKLVKAAPLPPGCGTIAWAVVQKFEVISTTFPDYNKKYVLIIQPCPEFLKERFFETGKTYDIDVATNSGVTFDYCLVNIYEKEKLPIFWARDIKRVD